MRNLNSNPIPISRKMDDHTWKIKLHAQFGHSNPILERPRTNHSDRPGIMYDLAAKLDALRRWLTLEQLDCLQLSASLEKLWTASILPPITKSSLSELDIRKIINSPKLRHDLNFEPEITFRPNSDGARGRLKIEQAKEYWEALSVELAIYIARKCRMKSKMNDSSFRLEGSLQLLSIPWRLQKLLQSLKEILKILIPGLEWSAVDQRLDVDLLMQEFDKGACDLVSLIEWLGGILLRSCSPMRDDTVLKMVKTVRVAAQTGDPRELVHGLKNLFGILETMKLDVANHQIRYLRLMMIDDSVHFEQKYFLKRIAAGTINVAQARDWYATAVQNERYNLDASNTHLAAFARSIIVMVMSNDVDLPTTFTFDVDRLQLLHVQIQKCMFQVICREAFIQCLSGIGYFATPSMDACSNLIQRVSNVSGRYSTDNSGNDRINDVALEIVREAYRVRALDSLPDEALVERTQGYLSYALQRDSHILQNLEDWLCIELEDMVNGELEQISKLTPLQLLDRYAHSRNRVTSTSAIKGPDDLQVIAQQIAHITVLHWRVWGPILYLQPRMVVADQENLLRSRTTYRPLSQSSPALNRLSEAGSQDGNLEILCDLPTTTEQIRKTEADLPMEDSQRKMKATSDELATAVGGMCLIQPRKPREEEREEEMEGQRQRQRRCSSPLA